MPISRSLEELVAPCSVARVIDAFAKGSDLASFGFHHSSLTASTGASCYHPVVMLKIYLYGYIKGICSSRKLEDACRTNIELMWLTEEQYPSYHTISTFRTFKLLDEQKGFDYDHSRSIKALFHSFVRFCKEHLVIEGTMGALDGTKIRAQNARNKNFTASKLAKKLERATADVEKYLTALEDIDEQELGAQGIKAELQAQLQKAEERQTTYTEHQKTFDQAKVLDPTVTQLSLTDKEARLMSSEGDSGDVCYNIQSFTDAKNSLIADYSVENVLDTLLLCERGESAMAVLEVDEISILADGIYGSGKQLTACEAVGVTTYVSPSDRQNKNKDKGFTSDKFLYNDANDTLKCPLGQQLTANGEVRAKKKAGQILYQFKTYSCPAGICKECPMAKLCLSASVLKAGKGRVIERSEHQGAIDRNRQRVEANKDIYAKRKCIVEHPFGTIKRQRGRTFTLVKGRRKVTAEFGLVFMAYNITRMMNILTPKIFIEKLKTGSNNAKSTGNTSKIAYLANLEAIRRLFLKMSGQAYHKLSNYKWHQKPNTAP